MKHIPLSDTFLLTSIIGLMITVFLTVQGKLTTSWAFLLNLMFIIFIISAFVSASPSDDEIALN